MKRLVRVVFVSGCECFFVGYRCWVYSRGFFYDVLKGVAFVFWGIFFFSVFDFFVYFWEKSLRLLVFCILRIFFFIWRGCLRVFYSYRVLLGWVWVLEWF